MKDLVSVVIPMYNAENNIYDTIKSVLNQTYKNIEIIIIDDGSTDKSAYIVNKIMKQCACNIKYYYQNNSGVSSARNNGIKKSSGKYIAFIDSDDLWDESKIEKQINMLNRTKMKACYCGFSNFYELTKLIKQVKIKFLQGEILYDFLKDNTWGWTSTWVIDKSLIENSDISFTEGCNWGEDFEFFVKIASVTEICCVSEYLALYTIRENSLTKEVSVLQQSNDIYVWINLYKWMEKNLDRLIYKDIEKIASLIYYFRIPNSLISHTYLFVKNSNNKMLFDNIELINKNINNKYIKDLKLNNGVKSIKLLLKLQLIKFRIFICNFNNKMKFK